MWSKCYPLSPLFQFLVTSRTVGYEFCVVWVTLLVWNTWSITNTTLSDFNQTDKEANYSVLISLLLLEEHLKMYLCIKRITEIFYRHWRVRSTSNRTWRLHVYFRIAMCNFLRFSRNLFYWFLCYRHQLGLIMESNAMLFFICFGMEGEISGTANTCCHNC